jgi:hypothetical protein
MVQQAVKLTSVVAAGPKSSNIEYRHRYTHFILTSLCCIGWVLTDLLFIMYKGAVFMIVYCTFAYCIDSCKKSFITQLLTRMGHKI